MKIADLTFSTECTFYGDDLKPRADSPVIMSTCISEDRYPNYIFDTVFDPHDPLQFRKYAINFENGITVKMYALLPSGAGFLLVNSYMLTRDILRDVVSKAIVSSTGVKVIMTQAVLPGTPRLRRNSVLMTINLVLVNEWWCIESIFVKIPQVICQEWLEHYVNMRRQLSPAIQPFISRDVKK